MSPRTLFRAVALAEAATWTLLLLGLFLKYVTHTTETGVSIGGGLHGFVFLCYVASTCFIWVNQKWSAGTGLLALASAVVPYATVPVEKMLDRRGLLNGGWRLADGGEAPRGPLELAQAWVLRHPVPALAVVLAGVAAVFGFLLFLGPPDTWLT
ncbi:DUF3817 domain-containing protein [Arthrobacter mobilis]|uniref:DUF3817 domain-containing protein n=1 Tax=Arthrobacter mobilis TaxID=2724944 RepID=A0A7X6HAZ9_9MICC|nr:DUF3817 domain-containing protein [Arthrobacter mobilis]NKX53656.1 DUF3817 domain-containing protein [Arthrobacter mobilis]